MPNLAAIIMAAGKGTRMKSKLPKVMHSMAGRPLIEHALTAVEKIKIPRILVILGHSREIVEERLAGKAEFVVQAEQLGTGHAIMQTVPFLDGIDTVFVLSGDQPLLKSSTLQALLDVHQAKGCTATVLTARFDNPFGYGRIVKDGENLVKIVEEKDATEEQKQIKEINTGTYCFNVPALKEALAQITPKNAQGEYYLTDVFDIFKRNNAKLASYCTDDPDEALGINNRKQLVEAEQIYRGRIADYWMEQGVTIVDPASTFIDAEVEIDQDVTILPFTFLQGKTRIEEDAVVGPQVLLDSTRCGKGSQISYSVAKNANIGENCIIGPYAYLRPGSQLDTGVKVGDFVEIKNSYIGEGSKIPHLSYIGDAEVGKAVNIGAGTITCNYDGVKKHTTKIGDNAFIGSNTNLVAPVEIGDNALTGAGSTITKNVPAQALVVERSQQVVRENWHRKKDK